MKRTHTERGFTLVEVLVSLGVLAAMLYVTADVMGALKQTPQNEQTVQITRAANAYLEQSVNAWRKAEYYGNVNLLPAPQAVPGTAAQARVCTVDPVSQTSACGSFARSPTKPTYAGNATTVTAGVRLIRLDMRYTPTTGRTVTTSLEIARR